MFVRDDSENEPEPEYAELFRTEGAFKLVVDMLLPGYPVMEGVRLRLLGGRERSVGGRGAGPGFMN